MTTLVLIRGLPGSGKSTIAKKEFSTFKHYEADAYFIDLYSNYDFKSSDLPKVHNWCFIQVRNELLNGNDVVVSNTFTTVKEMERYYNLREIIPTLRIVIWECTTNYGSIHNVPEETILKMKKRWQQVPSTWIINSYRKW